MSKVSFNVDYLKEQAAALAQSQSWTVAKKPFQSIEPILDEAKNDLREAYRNISQSVKQNKEISPAAEWLLDNFYIVQEQIVQVANDFPKEYQMQVPRLTKGSHIGLPRVYELALNLVLATDSVLDIQSLTSYVESYQQKEVLTQGEIWAIPIMIRFVLIEQLARKSKRVLERKNIKPLISELVSELLKEQSREPGQVLRKLTNWMEQHSAKGNERIVLVEMVNMMQASGLLLNEEKRWFEFRFNQVDLSFDEALRQEAREQSGLQVSIQNNITSLRNASELNWADYAEEWSVMDTLLCNDPAGIYSKMDFKTRDSYRNKIEQLSRRSAYTETEVTRITLALAGEDHADDGRSADRLEFDRTDIRKHVGYYLIGKGYDTLRKKIGYSVPLKERIRILLERHSGIYIAAILTQTALLLSVFWYLTTTPENPWMVTLIVFLVAFLPALDLSIASVNRLFFMILPPRGLPKMDFEHVGIPDASRTVVIVPTMLTSPEDVERQLELLEIRSLANPDNALQFGILADFTDAGTKELESDHDIVERCNELVSGLNAKYASKYGDKFFLFQRERQENTSEGVWMGWERKRGKIEEFNRLLLDPSAVTSYLHRFGNLLDSVKNQPVAFVITLDADTRLPPDSARDLIRTAAHPLNRASCHPEQNRVDMGYGIIQPRISIPPDSTKSSWFAFIFSGNVGLDPYSTAVSDIYQDLKGEAIFTGKGIYDLKVFHKVLNNRLPVNRILSHDLLESTYLHTGLATDIELFDDYPATYANFSKRVHRWTRGDWQIARWIFSAVYEYGKKVPNKSNLLSRWKIFDNLRRSTYPLSLILFFVTGWFWLPGSAVIWTLAGLGVLAFPIYISFSGDILSRPAKMRWKIYLEQVRANLRINSLQVLSTLIIFPHQALIQADAICRVIWRLTVSKKGLLNWITASETEKSTPNSLPFYLKMTLISPVLGFGILILAIALSPLYWQVVVPFAVLWIGAPVYIWLLSQPIKSKAVLFTEKEQKKLQSYARRTWFYFETFVNKEHSWLPPDNYQVDPPIRQASRTSPTNIGLSLVSTVVAFNRGYITMSELFNRTERTLVTMKELERYKGHYFNWYGTELGETMHPRYVSTVDSGNLAAGLLVIKEAVKQVVNVNGKRTSAWEGLQDTLRTVEEISGEFRNSGLLTSENQKHIATISNGMRQLTSDAYPETVSGDLTLLRSLKPDARQLSMIDLQPVKELLPDGEFEVLYLWLGSPLRHLETFEAEWELFDGVEGARPGFQTLNELSELADASEDGERALRFIEQLKIQAERIVSISEQLVSEMDFTFLYNDKRKLFHIGYNTETAQLDASTYDLLASEARIASYIAIAKGDISADHWFRLGRRLTTLKRNEILVSWGGTMFEYLMPLLFMRSFPNTLLFNTYESVIGWQRAYGQKRGYPWGSSESAYYFLNLDMHYQYRTFGVPGLGLKRGLAEDYVVAPYASMLSLMIQPRESLLNLENIAASGGIGSMGFYDAIDYTPSRLKEEETHKVVKTYMAHHHGMTLLAIENVLNDWIVNHYFHSDPQIRGCDLLLQEKIPRGVLIKEPHPIEVELEPGDQIKLEYLVEHAGINDLDQSPPRLHLLSNGNYATFITHAGTGLSRYNDSALTAWEPDPTADPMGLFFYIKDVESGEYWSAGHQPVKKRPDRYDSWFHNGKYVCSRVDEWIETTTEVCVSSEYPVELRKITLTNYSALERTLEVTSYAEIVLNRLADHQMHPAFSRLFLQTDYVEEHHGIIAKRRPRGHHEGEQWIIHAVTGHELENLTQPLQFETERSKFVGRGRSLQNPAAMDNGQDLSGSIGNVSDPVFSLRRGIKLMPGEKVQLVFGIGWADNRETAVHLADMIDNPYAADREFDLATIYSGVELEHIGVSARQAHYFQKLASYMIYPDVAFRGPEWILRKNRKNQSGLWAYGISGDLPLFVYRISDSEQLKTVRMLLKAHTFWKMKGLHVDLLILNDHPPSYADELQEAIEQSVESSWRGQAERRGHGDVFVLKSDSVDDKDLDLFLTVADAVFEGRLPAVFTPREPDECRSFYHDEMASRYKRKPPAGSDRVATAESAASNVTIRDTASELADGSGHHGGSENRDGDHAENGFATRPPDSYGLQFFNGNGGFSADGTEYHILIPRHSKTFRPVLPPAPWINVISNPTIGFTVSERGAGYTWTRNSRENKLSTWSNDPVCDPCSEAFYIRDEDLRYYWSPLPAPCAGDGAYRVIHGFGYTRFEHESDGLEQQMTQFVPVADPVKISVLTLKNSDTSARRLSVFRYMDLVMGVKKHPSSRFIIQSVSDEHDVLFAQNHYNNEFAGSVAFHGMNVPETSAEICFSGDRERFIGRNRSVGQPGALHSLEKLEGTITVGGDPCAAFQAIFDLEPGQTVTIISLSGETQNHTLARKLFNQYSDPERVELELNNVKKLWRVRLSRIQVKTPDKSLDVMLNGWLMYQNLSSRLQARTAFYQAGGAYGFRDQLQDVMAAIYSDPAIARDQILLHASKQFREGDVLHWWHPPTGRGIRSKITDDRLWLPYVTEFYISATGDTSILDENTPFIHARDLRDDEHEAYLEPEVIPEMATVYEHCCRAVDISLKMGQHGLPLIGAGDWNDGMNRVGEKGQGESVWLGFFLYDILTRFKIVCEKHGDESRAKKYGEIASRLRENLNDHAWDGAWYLRAFYDDGTPLGSAKNDECRIDAISQAWSVISGAATSENRATAMTSVEKHLVSEKDRLIKLLTPAFDKTEKDPGYIRGYIPGVRENGGQYTHAALWTIKAFAETGMGDKAVGYLDMINPVNHSRNPQEVACYKVEPYVVAADVYGEPPLTGQGGWTWYTGSAGWMYRVALESVLGITFRGDELLIKPAISSAWEGYHVRIVTKNETCYSIEIKNPNKLQTGILTGTVDGAHIQYPQSGASIRMNNDGKTHEVNLVIASG